MIVCMAHYPKTTLAAHLTPEELKRQYRRSADAKQARRWHVLWLCSTGMPIGEIATTVGLHRNWVRTVIKRYNADGPGAVADGHRRRPGGRRPVLTPGQEQALRAALSQRPADGGHWTGPKVAAWIQQQTGRPTVHPQLGWVYLRKLGFTPHVPRPRHRDAASPAAQDAWKKS